MKKLLVINALLKKHYNDCHILGSINVPLDELAVFAQKLEKDTPIIVYCASYLCPVSRKAWYLLHRMGFTNVWAYEGGIAEWVQKGYLAQGACQEEYLNAKKNLKKVMCKQLPLKS